MGSDQDFHYFAVRQWLTSDNYFKVHKAEWPIQGEFPLAASRSKWVALPPILPTAN